jgi:hypothetical protein
VRFDFDVIGDETRSFLRGNQRRGFGRSRMISIIGIEQR